MCSSCSVLACWLVYQKLNRGCLFQFSYVALYAPLLITVLSVSKSLFAADFQGRSPQTLSVTSKIAWGQKIVALALDLKRSGFGLGLSALAFSHLWQMYSVQWVWHIQWKIEHFYYGSLRFRINLAFHAQYNIVILDNIVILGLKDHWCWPWPWKNGLKPIPSDFIFGTAPAFY